MVLKWGSLKKFHYFRGVLTSGFLMMISTLESFGFQIPVCLKFNWPQKQYAEGRKREAKDYLLQVPF